MPANTTIIPLKAIRTGSQATGDVTALGELNSGDKLDPSWIDLSSYSTSSVINTNLSQKLGATATVTLTGDVTAGATAFSANAVSLSTSLATGSGSTLANYMQVSNTTVLVNDRVQVANLNSTLASYWPSANVISHVSTEIAALVDTAPAALDTLNELAAALGDDANFASTVNTNLSQKLGATATVALTGDVTASATAFSSNAVSVSTSLATSTGSTLANYMQVANTTVLVNDRLQVANAAATYQTIAVERAALANTNTRIAVVETNVGQKLGATATVTLTGDVTASATAFSANAVSLSTSLATSSGSTLANYITVANTAATYQTIAVERAALANTNAYIATKEDVGTATAMAIALG